MGWCIVHTIDIYQESKEEDMSGLHISDDEFPSADSLTITVQQLIFQELNFRGLTFSNISLKQFSRAKDSVSTNTVF